MTYDLLRGYEQGCGKITSRLEGPVHALEHGRQNTAGEVEMVMSVYMIVGQ